MKIDDIDFILSHFKYQSQLFPRKISTAASSNKQFRVYNKEQIFNECYKADFIDCRVNAYPEYTEFKGIIRQPPNFIFIDLDLANFGMDKKRLDLQLNKTLKKIDEYKGFPSILWSGNGYHIYLPISAIVLDQESVFSKERFPSLFSATGKYHYWSVSEVFLKYAEIFFTGGKADPLHKPKFKTCLTRIPGSYNSKLLNQGLGKENSLVKVIQRWNDRRIFIQYLLKDFRRWLVQEEINQKIQNNKFQKLFTNNINNNISRIEWIEKLLKIPIEDYRKYCLWRILSPYLVNIRKVSNQETIALLDRWLVECNGLRKTDFNHIRFITNNIRYVKSYLPSSKDRLKNNSPDLYALLKAKNIVS